MRCIHTATGLDAKIGDAVANHRGEPAVIVELPKPHKPDSEGFVTVKEDGMDGEGRFYCGVFGLAWIEREDRA